MRGNTLNKIAIVICAVLALTSCKARKQIITGQPAAQTPVQPANPQTEAAPMISAKAVNDGIRAGQVNFNTFSGKAKARLDIDGSGNDVSLNIRIQRDKKIWVSISATVVISIEIARALITPDSIIIINKLQGVYLKKPFSYIYQYVGNQVNFKTVQALLLGNALPETLNDNSKVTTAENSTVLTGNLQNMLYRLAVADTKVTQTNLTDPLANLSLQVNNLSYTPVDNRMVPAQINIVSSAGEKKINVNLHYNNMEFDKVLDYPFNIPGSYTPAN